MHVPMKFLAGALALGLSACALDSAARPPSLDNPSNPDAPESRPYPSAALRAPEPPPAGEPPHPHGAHGSPGNAAPILAASEEAPTSTVVYTCPMHPRITASESGRCPQCGMKLVPREAPPPRGDTR